MQIFREFHKIFLFFALFSSVSLLGSEVVFRSQTKDEAFSFVMYLMRKGPWFKRNGYYIVIPDHPEFTLRYEKDEALSEGDTRYLEDLFSREIYDPGCFQAPLEKLVAEEETINRALDRLGLLQMNWSFKLMPKYEVVLTMYGPGGKYDPKKGHVVILIKKDGTFVKTDVSETILHEIVHIGIEEGIVQKYHLTHQEKEGVVDLICSHYLKDLVPGYSFQKIGNASVDPFVKEDDVIQDLPTAIERYIAHYPR